MTVSMLGRLIAASAIALGLCAPASAQKFPDRPVKVIIAFSPGGAIDILGRSIADKWHDGGTRTFLGVHTAGFPNLFIVCGPQAGGGKFNFIETIEEQTDYVIWMLSTMRDNGHDSVDIRPEWSMNAAMSRATISNCG